ncbi:hypothetical protein [Massilia sp. TS11]|uniref:hypothetical protein n=1 Tax=Massilia sp. TS11 TaxID=2908003 RepID=UPI001EDC8156|nr:hypothetical protein [Massilia sp. TS11]MCG2586122.1 hypothetical protein [Massilia sp. TS11]
MRQSIGSLSVVCALLLAACGGGNGGPGPQPVQSGVSVAAVPPLGAAYPLQPGEQVGSDAWPDLADSIGCYSEQLDGRGMSVHLSVLRDGEALAVPAGIGAADGACAGPIYTEDRSGVLHISVSDKHLPTLAEVFAAWGQPLSSTNVAGITEKTLHVFVIDAAGAREYEGDPRMLTLHHGDQIVLSLGYRPPALPVFRWNG